MSIEFKSEEGTIATSHQGLDMERVYSEIAMAAANASRDAVDKSHCYADALFKSMIADVKAQLNSIPKGNLVASIRTNGNPPVKLSTPMSTNRAIIMSKIVYMLSMRQNVMLVGPAGSGKTTLANQVAEGMGLPFYTISCSSGASESWLLGRRLASGYEQTDFVKAVREGGVFLIDEFDNADPNWTVAFHNALDKSRHFYNPISGETITKHENFFIIAAANTFGKGANMIYTGRNRLDAASLDRFQAKFYLDYCEETEKRLCPDDDLRTTLVNARTKLEQLGATEVISYRALEWSYAAKQSGMYSDKEIYHNLTQSWPKDLANKCGLVA